MVCVKTSTHMLNWENARLNCIVNLLFFFFFVTMEFKRANLFKRLLWEKYSTKSILNPKPYSTKYEDCC